jgi:transcriptional regulator with XRE-family HTH domain
MNFGNKLLEFRARHNLSQKQTADIVGVSYEMISQYETGKYNPTAKNKIIFENKMKEWEGKKND